MGGPQPQNPNSHSSQPLVPRPGGPPLPNPVKSESHNSFRWGARMPFPATREYPRENRGGKPNFPGATKKKVSCLGDWDLCFKRRAPTHFKAGTAGQNVPGWGGPFLSCANKLRCAESRGEQLDRKTGANRAQRGPLGPPWGPCKKKTPAVIPNPAWGKKKTGKMGDNFMANQGPTAG